MNLRLTTKKIWKGLLLLILLITCLFIFTDVYQIFLGPLDIGSNVDHSYGDIILVLGGGLRKGLQLGYSTQERLNLAVQYYHQKKRPILVTGCYLTRESKSAKRVIDYLVKQKVKDEFILIEGNSYTTFENIFNSKQIIEKNGYKEVVVCTSPYH